MKILLVEDHQDVAEVIYDYFELKGHVMDWAKNGEHAQTLLKQEHYDVVILDVMLPGISGLTLCERIRAEGSDTPILMLTARDTNEDIICGLKQGADDYLVKPFDLSVLEARVEALLRRTKGAMKKVLTFGQLELDTSTQMLTRGECQFQLSHSLYLILKLLMLRAPAVVSRQEIAELIWGEDTPDTDVLRSYIYQLRNKIDKPFKHQYLHTIPTVGYQLIAEQEG